MYSKLTKEYYVLYCIQGASDKSPLPRLKKGYLTVAPCTIKKSFHKKSASDFALLLEWILIIFHGVKMFRFFKVCYNLGPFVLVLLTHFLRLYSN